jgi:hypothetical protein
MSVDPQRRRSRGLLRSCFAPYHKPRAAKGRRLAARWTASQMPIHQRARIQPISIVGRLASYKPVPVALDVFVEDSHLVGLFGHRRARSGVDRHALASTLLGRPSLDRLACWSAES